MRRNIIWALVVVALVAIPAVVGLLVVGGDGGRNQAALVQEGAPGTSYQLVLAGITPAGQAISVDGYSWGVENQTTIGSATSGAGAGKAKFQDLQIVKKVDEVSTALFKAAATGQHAATGTLKLYKGESKGGQPYMTYTLKTVFVSSLSQSGSGGEVPNEQVQLVVGAVTTAFADPAVGKAPALPKFGWDITKNIEAN
jgi:type VI secretion system secreted protein Hcp